MVAIIEGKEEAGGARYIEFKVDQSPADPNRIVGSWRFPSSESAGMVIDQSRLDTTIETEFRHAVDCADQHGIPFVWVNDPDELFPPFNRP